MSWPPQLAETTKAIDRVYLRRAYEIANELSDHPFTKVGAILVQNRANVPTIIGYGANQFPENVLLDPDLVAKIRTNREWMRKNMIHAEVAAIDDAQEADFESGTVTMYLPWLPCEPCAERIVNVGIARLVTHQAMIGKTPERWHESISAGIERLVHGRVLCEQYSGVIGRVEALFDGQLWHP